MPWGDSSASIAPGKFMDVRALRKRERSESQVRGSQVRGRGPGKKEVGGRVSQAREREGGVRVRQEGEGEGGGVTL